MVIIVRRSVGILPVYGFRPLCHSFFSSTGLEPVRSGTNKIRLQMFSWLYESGVSYLSSVLLVKLELVQAVLGDLRFYILALALAVAPMLL